MKNLKVLVVLRHVNSLSVVREYLSRHGIQSIGVVLDRAENPSEIAEALNAIETAIRVGINAVVTGTKVYEIKKLDKDAPPEALIDFLLLLKSFGCSCLPILMTHLSEMPEYLAREINKTGLDVTWVENDNLKNDGMKNLGPLIMEAFKGRAVNQ